MTFTTKLIIAAALDLFERTNDLLAQSPHQEDRKRAETALVNVESAKIEWDRYLVSVQAETEEQGVQCLKPTSR